MLIELIKLVCKEHEECNDNCPLANIGYDFGEKSNGGDFHDQRRIP